jgi:hypothetical protein
VCRSYFIVVPRPFPAAPLAMRRTYWAEVARPVLRPFPAATRHAPHPKKSSWQMSTSDARTRSWCSGRSLGRCLWRRDAAASGFAKEQSSRTWFRSYVRGRWVTTSFLERLPRAITYNTPKNGGVLPPRGAQERARFLADFAVTTKEPQWPCAFKSMPT